MTRHARAAKQCPPPVVVEVVNVLGWAGTGACIAGALMVLAWAAFTFIDDVSQYIPYAAPLVSDGLVVGLAVGGFTSLASFVASMVAIQLVIAGKAGARSVAILAAMLQAWLVPAGPVFALITWHAVKALPGSVDGTGVDAPAISTGTGKTLAWLVAMTAVLVFAGILLFLPGVYFLPVEFLNDEDLSWIRENIWNVVHGVVVVAGCVAGLLVASAFMAWKEARGWRGMMLASCLVLLPVIPVGSYIAGVLYRTLLKHR